MRNWLALKLLSKRVWRENRIESAIRDWAFANICFD